MTSKMKGAATRKQTGKTAACRQLRKEMNFSGQKETFNIQRAVDQISPRWF
jgi:hypothetical protein